MNHKYLKNSNEVDLKQIFSDNLSSFDQVDEDAEDDISLKKEEFQFLEKRNILNLILNFTSDKKLNSYLKTVDKEKLLLLKYLALKEDQEKIKLFERLSELLRIKNGQNDIKNYIMEKNSREKFLSNPDNDSPLKKKLKIEKLDVLKVNLVRRQVDSFFNIEEKETLFLENKGEQVIQSSKGEIIEKENDYYFQGSIDSLVCNFILIDSPKKKEEIEPNLSSEMIEHSFFSQNKCSLEDLEAINKGKYDPGIRSNVLYLKNLHQKV